MTVEHRRPLLAFVAVVVLAIAIVSSHLEPGQVGRFVQNTPAAVSSLSPDTLLGRALSVVPGRPAGRDLGASPDAARADRAAAGRPSGAVGTGGAANRDGRAGRDDRANGSAAGVLGISLTRPSGAAPGGVAAPAPSTPAAGSSGGTGARPAPSTPTPTPVGNGSGRGHGVVGRATGAVSDTASRADRQVGRAHAEAVHAAHAARDAAAGVAGRLPSLAAPGTPVRSEGLVAGTSTGPGKSGRAHGRVVTSGSSSSAGPDARGPGRGHGQGHGRSPKAVRAVVAAPTLPRTTVQRPQAVTGANRGHATHQGRGHRAPTAAAPRAALPRAPRAEAVRTHAPRATASRAPQKARPDRGHHAAGPARGRGAGSHGHGRH